MPKDKESKTLQVKVPKGTRDWFGSDVALRDKIFGTITDVFKRHGAVTLDTPAFELKEILTGKYGEDSKLIYDLADQGGEICSLRYDLTLPTARFLAMNPTIQHLKRYQIAKVWRRDNPAIQKGRMREFTQCDFDIAGIFDPMLPDAEVLKITTEVFRELDFEGRYTIKVNHRKVLDGMFQVCGVPQEKIRAISSAVDKLDKSPWEEVRREMTEEKGLDPAVADKIGGYVKSDMDIPIGANCRERSLKVLESLERDEALLSNELAKQGIKDLRLLFDYLDIWNCTQYVSYDMSLARGLDYYTGPIWEVVTEGSKPKTMEKEERKPSKKKAANAEDVEDRSNDPTVGIGSIAAGGRYDELVGVFSKKGRIPCVGISFGVDRIFSIIKNRGAPPRAAEVDVYVMSFGGSGSLKERMQVAAMLWNAGITAEFAWKAKPKLPQQFKAAESSGVPYAVILGEDELKAGKVKIKELGLEEGHPEKEGVLLPMDELVEGIKSRLTAKRDAEKKKATDERNKRDEELQGKLADLQMKP